MGSFAETGYPNKPSPVSLEPVSLGSYEHFFAQTELPLAIFDLRATRGNNLFDSWRSNSYTIREMGWAYDPKYKEHLSNKTNLANAFDGAVWIDRVTPSNLR